MRSSDCFIFSVTIAKFKNFLTQLTPYFVNRHGEIHLKTNIEILSSVQGQSLAHTSAQCLPYAYNPVHVYNKI